MLVELGQFAVCAFICLVLYRASEYLKNLPQQRPRSVRQATAAPQSVADFKQEVAEHTQRTCPQCEGKFVGKKCGTCDYVPPIGLKHKRISFSNAKKELERPQ